MQRSRLNLAICVGAILTAVACELSPGTAPLATVGALHVAINPRDFTLATCSSLQLSVTAANSAGVPVKIDSVSWSSSDTLVAPISSSGLVAADTSVGTDTAYVTAYAGKSTGSASAAFQVAATDVQLGSGTVVDIDCATQRASP